MPARPYAGPLPFTLLDSIHVAVSAVHLELPAPGGTLGGARMNDDPRMPDAEEDASPAPTAEVVRALLQNRSTFLSFLERRLGDRALAEDILQEAFARGLDKLETLRSDEAAVAWFYRALRNAVIDHSRRRQAAARALDAFAEELAHLEPAEETRAAVCQCIGRLAKTLKPEYAEALSRVEVEGTTVKAFAEERGITSGNAAVRVFRAREALRRQVVAWCGACAEHGCTSCCCAKPT
jgi:RNA polymerase sigma factor (sigma-70 family)